MSSVIRQALSEYVPDEASNPFAAWAGECGLFLDVVCQIADERGVAYEIGNAYNGKIDGAALVPPPGLTLEDCTSYRLFENLDHIWLLHSGRHFDAATPSGVAEIFELRIFRQVAVELLRRSASGITVLNKLMLDHTYWHESAQLFDAYLAEMGNLS